ncbi:thioredoxin family protein [Planococcus lenghuensis]|uniref:Thiol reductase thioredoxin n=1 Tax=Planococcus lenghuensis TaxID=2213202 RepID=A0A1Q2KYA5_9BACL|nr:thioredoxin family protein [Planococcus lenghuensis]AQQ52777.1 thiol reductase thioredoxin [Planococcus lenghuensis]
MRELKSIEEFNTIKAEGPAVVLFTAGWCPDCRVIEPVLPEIEAAYPQYEFAEADRDRFIDLCGDLGIFGIPSFIAFKDGVELGRFVSKDRKTREEIEAFLDSLQ